MRPPSPAVSQATHRPLSCLARAGYFFDLNGWIRVPAVFSLDEIAQMNAAIDRHLTPASTIHRDRPVTAEARLWPGGGREKRGRHPLRRRGLVRASHRSLL